MHKALIFANGKPKDGVMVQRTLSEAQGALVFAADGGARVARYYALNIHTVVGDMDSLIPDEVLQLQAKGVEIIRHPIEKDETDLELTLILAAERDMQWIRIIGGLGGRFDQMLANVYLLTLPPLEGRDVAVVAGKQSIQLLRPGTHTLNGESADTLSLIPIAGPVHGIATDALKYPLNDETLYFGPARGISNIFEQDQVKVTLREGLLLAVHTKGRA